MTRSRSALTAVLAAALVLAPSGFARAEGSVPSEVATYVSGGALVAQLNDVYGPGPDGGGIDFDETTKPGVIERVHVWSAELRAGEDTENPVDLVNEWVVPIVIAEDPVGLATIWINPATADPELAAFEADPELATALSAVADGSSLVHDPLSDAWLALAADGTLTPLVPGTTGLSTPVPLDDVALLPAPSGASPPSGDPATGVGFAIAVLLFLIAVIIVVLVVPVIRAKRRATVEVEPDPEPDPEPEPEPVAEPEPETAPEAPKKPASRKKKLPAPPAE